MKAIITGVSGTVGRALIGHFEANGHLPVSWNRAEVPLDDYHAMEAFVARERPDALFHLAVPSQPVGRDNENWWVTYHWTSELAWICRVLNVRFVFTSTVMVFTDHASGPFTPDSEPDVEIGYGFEKLQAERRAFYQNPDAIVARLGWQIGETTGSNNMLDHLERQMSEHGEIRASRKWLPSCSFVQDTAAALTALVNAPGGLYMLNSNERWSYYDIVRALNVKHGNRWKVTADDSFEYDQRMIDPRVGITPLNVRLPQLDA